MPSWLSGVVELSILQRFRSFSDLAAQTLSEWGHVDERTDRVIENEMQRLMEDPDESLDEESALNVAGYAGDEYYATMLPLSQLMTNLFALGLFHLFEQQLIDFARIMGTSIDVPTRMPELFKLFSKCLNTDIGASYPMAARLNELRLVANVVKHAEGNSAEELKALRPDLFEHPDVRKGWEPKPGGIPFVREPLSGQGLYVTREDYDAFTQDVEAFWHRLKVDLDRTFA